LKKKSSQRTSSSTLKEDLKRIAQLQRERTRAIQSSVLEDEEKRIKWSKNEDDIAQLISPYLDGIIQLLNIAFPPVTGQWHLKKEELDIGDKLWFEETPSGPCSQKGDGLENTEIRALTKAGIDIYNGGGGSGISFFTIIPTQENFTENLLAAATTETFKTRHERRDPTDSAADKLEMKRIRQEMEAILAGPEAKKGAVR
jgi:hypothetical protein